MPKRFTDSKIQSLKPTNKRAILFEDGGRGFGIRIEPSGRKSFFLEYRFGKRERTTKQGLNDRQISTGISYQSTIHCQSVLSSNRTRC